MLRRAAALLGIVGVSCGIASVQAGTATYEFTTDPSAELEIFGNNLLPWHDAGGNTGGFLALTHAVDSENATILFPDIDPGQVVTAFKFEADLRIGNSSDADGRPADGFAISFARGSDPILADPANSANFAAGLPEAGTTTGIAVGFDTWAGNTLPDGGDIEGIIVRVDNVTVLRQAVTTRNGACEDVNSLQTGPVDTEYWTAGAADAYFAESWDTLCWQPLIVEMSEDGKLTVTYKGRVLLDGYQTSYFPTAGRLVLSGRTGGNNEHTHIDNVVLTTTAVSETEPPTTPGDFAATFTGARRVELEWSPSTDDSGRVAYEVLRDDVVISTGLLLDTTFIDSGVRPGTTYQYGVRAVDVAQNPSPVATLSVTTAAEVAAPGYLVAEIYDGLTGTAVSDIYVDPDFPATPDRVIYVPGINTPSVGENYGMRVTGTLTVPQTGAYDFFIRSDDASQFFLNSTGTAIPDPNVELPIAEETDCCDAFQEVGVFNDDGFTSAATVTPVTLTAGQQYGFLVLLKEGGGGDYVQVAMRQVGDSTPASELQPIAGPLVTGLGDPTGASVTISQQPETQTVIANEALTLSVTAANVSPYGAGIAYQWYKNNNIIPGATGTSYTIPVVAAGDAGTYKVFVGTLGANTFSSDAVITVNTDTKAPTIASAVPDDTFESVTVTFSEPVTTPSATTAANYTLSGGETVSAATQVDPFTIRLTTSELAESTDYTLTINNVQDAASNTIAANSTADFTSWELVPNRVQILRYNNIGGTAAASLYEAEAYPENPDVVDYLTGVTFGETTNFGNTYGDNFGAVLRAYLIPEESGDYHFFVRSDDASQLFLSTDGTLPDPVASIPIAEETGCCEAFKEPNDTAQPFETTTTPITLTAGQRYGLVFVVKEGGGGDWGQVAMRRVGDTTPAGSLAALSDEVYYFGPASTDPEPTLVDVTAPGDTITMVNGTSPASGNESVGNAINDTTAKYLNFGTDAETSAPFVGPVGLIVTPAAGSSIVTGLRVYTANDAEVRDPADYVLEGSNDGTTFTQISAGPLALPATRNANGLSVNPATLAHQEVLFANTTAYSSYRLMFNNVKNNATANSMQLAEIELLGEVVDGGEPEITINRSGGTITITYEGTLQSSSTVDGTYSDVTGASNPYVVNPTGEAMFFQSVDTNN